MLTSGQTSADVKVEPRSTFTFRLRVAFHSLPLSGTYARKFYVGSHGKFCGSGNQPSVKIRHTN